MTEHDEAPPTEVPPPSPPPPPWGSAPPPWGGAPRPPWSQPGAWGANPWQPLPPAPAPAPATGRGGTSVILTVVAVVVAALVGATVGSRLFPSRSAGPVASATFPGDPSPGSGLAPSSPSGGDAGASAIAAKVVPGVVDINTTLRYQQAQAAGTGMVLTPAGEVLTNNHVIDGATTITATVVTTGRTYAAKVIGTDPTADIAVLQLQGASGLRTIPAARSAGVAAGNPVVAIGNAGGAGGAPSVVTGTVNAVDQTITASDQGGANAEQLSGLIQTDAPIAPGDSGGPLVDTSAHVIGMNTAASVSPRYTAAASEGFAIPIGHALDVAQQIEAGKPTATVHIGLPGFLGVQIVPDGQGQAGTTPGAVVALAEPGLPAADAGLARGDTITTVDGQPVPTAASLSTLLRRRAPGSRVVIGWTDATGAAHHATVTLATGPAD